jgi:predicted transcriptional regulator
MRQETIKLELIEWLTSLKDVDTLQYLKIIKDARADNKDWWSELTEEQRLGIQRGLKDIDEGRIVSHSDVKKKYGL